MGLSDATAEHLLTVFSILHGKEQLFASKYVLYLPSEAELRAEIETQKEIFLEQHQKNV